MIKKKSPESKPNIILETEIHVHLYLTFKDFLVTIYNDMKSSFSIDLHGNKNFDLYRKKFWLESKFAFANMFNYCINLPKCI